MPHSMVKLLPFEVTTVLFEPGQVTPVAVGLEPGDVGVVWVVLGGVQFGF